MYLKELNIGNVKIENNIFLAPMSGITDSSFRKITIEYLDRIRELIKKYGYDVPVIDICTGKPYKENVTYREYVKTLKKI